MMSDLTRMSGKCCLLGPTERAVAVRRAGTAGHRTRADGGGSPQVVRECTGRATSALAAASSRRGAEPDRTGEDLEGGRRRAHLLPLQLEAERRILEGGHPHPAAADQADAGPPDMAPRVDPPDPGERTQPGQVTEEDDVEEAVAEVGGRSDAHPPAEVAAVGDDDVLVAALLDGAVDLHPGGARPVAEQRGERVPEEGRGAARALAAAVDPGHDLAADPAIGDVHEMAGGGAVEGEPADVDRPGRTGGEDRGGGGAGGDAGGAPEVAAGAAGDEAQDGSRGDG